MSEAGYEVTHIDQIHEPAGEKEPGEPHTPYHEFLFKLGRVKDRMVTRTARQRELVNQTARLVAVSTNDIVAVMSPADRKEHQHLKSALEREHEAGDADDQQCGTEVEEPTQWRERE